MHFLDKLKSFEAKGVISPEIGQLLAGLFQNYKEAIISNGGVIEDHIPLLNQFLDSMVDQFKNPYSFGNYHQKITEPVDYYHFGLDFLRPIVKLNQSTIQGENSIAEIEAHIKNGENVVLFSNHQTEPDPQAISLLLEKSHSRLAQDMIFVAGHRVTTDPLSVPFSLGRNLLCIFSKRYVEHPPEEKREKVHHNQKTMKIMRELLSEGGKCIYVAPSGGRDRPNQQGVVEVSPFDPQSIEMFWFTANHSARPTHFYPLALATYDLFPPPDTINISLGEARQTKSAPIHLSFGEEINMTQFPGSENPDKKQRRADRAKFIYGLVKELYKKNS